jgi:hypothetical protein
MISFQLIAPSALGWLPVVSLWCSAQALIADS